MDFSRLEGFLQWVLELGVPGVDLKICLNGEPVYRRFMGWRDREAGAPMTGDEVYWIYSASKLVTCASALQLLEQGRILLSDPVSAYLPGFDALTVRRRYPNGWEEAAPARAPMTVRHLFTMTSGLDYDLHTPEIEAAIRATSGRAPTAAMASVIARRPLWFEPGEHFLYGLSHDILAALVEAVSGERFADYVRAHIFEPCGMADSGYHLTDAARARMARQYLYRDDLRRAEPTDNANEFIFGSEYDSGGAGMYSTVDDYMRFLNMLLREGVSDSGERVLSARAVRLMAMNQLTDAQRRDLESPKYDGYGYGLGVRTLMEPERAGGLGAVGEYGWSGAAGAHAIVDPANHLTVYYAQHMLNDLENIIHPRLRNLIYAGLD